uniref:Secreted protein n=1 Tax=Steinernema glaseri TaxID=37863 RepID=A0A1I7ZBK1_9BILA
MILIVPLLVFFVSFHATSGCASDPASGSLTSGSDPLSNLPAAKKLGVLLTKLPLEMTAKAGGRKKRQPNQEETSNVTTDAPIVPPATAPNNGPTVTDAPGNSNGGVTSSSASPSAKQKSTRGEAENAVTTAIKDSIKTAISSTGQSLQPKITMTLPNLQMTLASNATISPPVSILLKIDMPYAVAQSVWEFMANKVYVELSSKGLEIQSMDMF